MSTKVRTYVNASSLGAYFGVGFNTPQDQIQIDMGLMEADIDADAERRMELGRILEQPVLDYFEKEMKITIKERNDQLYDLHNGILQGKVDGLTTLNGKHTVVECKISNAKSGSFVDDKGYYLQCQAYMLGLGAEQALLCGLYEGKPTYKIIARDEKTINDIKRMAEFISDVLMGLEDFGNYPMDILKRYSDFKLLPTIDHLAISDAQLKSLVEKKAQIKALETEVKAMEDLLKMAYSEGIYENKDLGIKVTLSEQKREGGIDIDALSIEHPEINYEKYRKPASVYKTLRINAKGLK